MLIDRMAWVSSRLICLIGDLQQGLLESLLDLAVILLFVSVCVIAGGAKQGSGKARGRGAKKTAERELLDAYAQVAVCPFRCFLLLSQLLDPLYLVLSLQPLARSETHSILCLIA